MTNLSQRDKSVLAGLFLAKFDRVGLRALGFGSFSEAFNVIGLAISQNPKSVKNHRDEFDPYFPNDRKGWHKRPMVPYCKPIFEAFKELDLASFSNLLKENIYKRHDLDLLAEEVEREEEKSSSFAKRLITGQAAEEYFRAKYKDFVPFKDLEIEDTTRLGCGFDFKLHSPSMYYGVEIKGLNDSSGSVTLTSKEYSVASILQDRYFLFVVKNFKDNPFHVVFQNPLSGELAFNRMEKNIIQVSWATTC